MDVGLGHLVGTSWARLEDLCVVAVSRSLSSPGVDLTSALKNLDQQKLLSDISSLFGEGRRLQAPAAPAGCLTSVPKDTEGHAGPAELAWQRGSRSC
eukprot:Skav217877  [mRNA]  locus=scaffold2487:227931:228221:+ [translate_table: standard]